MTQLSLTELLSWALAQLGQIAGRPDNPFLRLPPPEYHRGIDVYSGTGLARALARAGGKFLVAHGRLPDLADPRGWNEKLICAKFFMPIGSARFADKCRTGEFIPPELRDRIQPHRIVWYSDQPVLPENAAIVPGAYWLKANHGSGMNRRITYPLAPGERTIFEALCRQWLAETYGIAWGEWWYSMIPRRVFLCAEVPSPGTRLVDYGVFTVNGVVRMVTVGTRGAAQELDGMSFYDIQWNKHAQRKPGYANPDFPRPSTLETMYAAARRIGTGFSMIRVDFIHGEGGPLVLGELTQCPGNGLNRYEASRDLVRGAEWDITGWF